MIKRRGGKNKNPPPSQQSSKCDYGWKNGGLNIHLPQATQSIQTACAFTLSSNYKETWATPQGLCTKSYSSSASLVPPMVQLSDTYYHYASRNTKIQSIYLICKPHTSVTPGGLGDNFSARAKYL